VLHPVLQVGVSLITAQAAVLHRAAANKEAPSARLNESQYESKLADEFRINDRCEGAFGRLRTRRTTAGNEAFGKGGEGAPFGWGQDL